MVIAPERTQAAPTGLAGVLADLLGTELPVRIECYDGSGLGPRDATTRITVRSPDALRYILQSPQFGVYLFTDFAEHLRPPNTGLLRQIARSRTVAGRKVVFVGEAVTMPEGMDAMVEIISHQPVAGTRPRLRDGRWVI